MSGFTGWRVLVNFLLPPPLVLTFLLVLPLPRGVRKGLLLFTDKVLSLSVREYLAEEELGRLRRGMHITGRHSPGCPRAYSCRMRRA